MIMEKGTKIGKYTIIRELGQGGMGEVYEVEDHVLNKYALKKCFLQNKRNKDILQEAEMLKNLKHENIVAIQDIIQENDDIYLIMELIEGETLQKRMESNISFSLEEVLKIIKAIALALKYAHGKKIVHRDVKPGNIMIDKKGRIVLMDFGLARDLKNNPQLTNAGQGTTLYMSPEQIDPTPESPITHQTDIYSLGIMFYEMLTQHHPFRRQGESNIQVCQNILNSTPEPLNVYRREIPEPIEKICLSCLKKELSRRYQNMEDMLQDLSLENPKLKESFEKEYPFPIANIYSQILLRKECDGEKSSLILTLYRVIVKYLTTIAYAEYMQYIQKGGIPEIEYSLDFFQDKNIEWLTLLETILKSEEVPFQILSKDLFFNTKRFSKLQACLSSQKSIQAAETNIFIFLKNVENFRIKCLQQLAAKNGKWVHENIEFICKYLLPALEEILYTFDCLKSHKLVCITKREIQMLELEQQIEYSLCSFMGYHPDINKVEYYSISPKKDQNYRIFGLYLCSINNIPEWLLYPFIIYSEKKIYFFEQGGEKLEYLSIINEDVKQFKITEAIKEEFENIKKNFKKLETSIEPPPCNQEKPEDKSFSSQTRTDTSKMPFLKGKKEIGGYTRVSEEEIDSENSQKGEKTLTYSQASKIFDGDKLQEDRNIASARETFFDSKGNLILEKFTEEACKILDDALALCNKYEEKKLRNRLLIAAFFGDENNLWVKKLRSNGGSRTQCRGILLQDFEEDRELIKNAIEYLEKKGYQIQKKQEYIPASWNLEFCGEIFNPIMEYFKENGRLKEISSYDILSGFLKVANDNLKLLLIEIFPKDFLKDLGLEISKDIKEEMKSKAMKEFKELVKSIIK